MKIAVIDFSGEEQLAKRIADKGHRVVAEYKDGGKAYAMIGDELPDKIFIAYAHKPSHGRQTAAAIRGRKRTVSIPIYFVGGAEKDNALVADIGECISDEAVERYL